MGVGKFVHTVFKTGTAGKWTLIFSKLVCPNLYCFRAHKMVSSSRRPSPPTMSEIVPIFERLTEEELEEISPIVLWPNFDEDNIESFPQGWLGSWGEEEDECLFRVLRVCAGGAEEVFIEERPLASGGGVVRSSGA